MDIKDVLSLNCVRCAIEGSSKKRVLQTISQIASENLAGISSDDVLASLLCREKMGSTGIGNGIAIPHGRLNGLADTTAILVSSNSPIEFDAIDNQPVDIFFTLLVPSDKNEGHLQTLATIAKKLNDKTIVKHIRQATNNQALYEALL